MQRRFLLWVGTVGVFAVLAACGLADAGTRTLSMDVDVSPSVVSLGSTVTIQTRATGQSLFQTVVEYGNGVSDSVGTVGSEQNLTLTYTYPQAGTRTIRATVFDAVLGEQFDEVTVQVQDVASGN